MFGDLLQPVIIAGLDTINSFLGSINIDLETGRAVVERISQWLVSSRDEAAALGQMIGSGVNAALSITADLMRAGEEYLNKYPGVLDLVNVAVKAIGAGFQVWGDAINNVMSLVGELMNMLGQVANKMQEIGLTGWLDQTIQNITGGGSSGGSSLYQAIIGKESGGNYRAVNPDSGALGLGQVMPANVASWTKAALGKSLTPQQFLNDRAAQEKTIEYKL
ncbi:MAG: hypothetical protein N4J56_001757 [Chroococcidiopsis sp. SAG 2025]|uniref:transglycosylase SLT domain-containing protein n=1 Tax=Chroococcidiopsis sp. SAG 2025 TaxID=171389 RepID=UPI0029371DBE|nr:transglycosylase SLT domain-containing protein [Chroococcidiopsis sp. SAG 2025]MDV2992103.1 hypothetical protein [Chroococcidiopsis sp. SAG 2025]